MKGGAFVPFEYLFCYLGAALKNKNCFCFLEKGGRAYSYYLDVTNRHKVYELAKKIKAEIGDVDILVNNAGVITGRTFMNSPDEMIIKTMDVNINAHFWVMVSSLGKYLFQVNNNENRPTSSNVVLVSFL